MKKNDRIWELDALRGICILCVILIHLIFDLIYFIGLDLHLPAWYVFVQQYGGVIFVVLSGCCATLGSRSFRRGCIVFSCGMLISLVTFGMYRLGMASRDVIVWFGVLHLLGVCMMLYPVYKKLPTQALAAVGVVLVVTGYLILGTVVPCVLGASGVEQVIELPLSEEERAQFHSCCEGIRRNMQHLKEL